MLKHLAKATDTFIELFTIYICTILLAALSYGYFEGKGLGDSLWWAMVTAMTIGYGDLYPHTIGGRFVAVVLMHVVPLFVVPLITARLALRLMEHAK